MTETRLHSSHSFQTLSLILAQLSSTEAIHSFSLSGDIHIARSSRFQPTYQSHHLPFTPAAAAAATFHSTLASNQLLFFPSPTLRDRLRFRLSHSLTSTVQVLLLLLLLTESSFTRYYSLGRGQALELKKLITHPRTNSLTPTLPKHFGHHHSVCLFVSPLQRTFLLRFVPITSITITTTTTCFNVQIQLSMAHTL